MTEIVEEIVEEVEVSPEDTEEAENDKELISDEFSKEFLAGFDDVKTVDSEDEDEEEVKEEKPAEVVEEKTEPVKEEPVKEEAKPPEPLKVFFLGKEVEVQPEEIADWVQRGMNEERTKQKLAQSEEENKYISSFLDMAAYYDIKPEELIKHAIKGYEDMELQKFLDKNIPEDEAKELFNQRMGNARTARANQPKPKGKERDHKAEIDELMRLRPDLRGMKAFPQEVAEQITKGVDVKTAYLKYENQKLLDDKKTFESQTKVLEDKIKALEQEKKTAKAPGSVKGTGASAKRDAFLVGFNEA